MSDFEISVELTLRHEGGYVNNPTDPGGETNFGISKSAYPSLDIKNLTRQEAKEIYLNDYWNPLYAGIHSQSIANALFDFGVNAGTRRAVRTLQNSINDILVGPLVMDGIFGPGTLAATNSCEPEKLLHRFTTRRIEYYTSLNKPQFIKGWTARAMEV